MNRSQGDMRNLLYTSLLSARAESCVRMPKQESKKKIAEGGKPLATAGRLNPSKIPGEADRPIPVKHQDLEAVALTDVPEAEGLITYPVNAEPGKVPDKTLPILPIGPTSTSGG